MTLISRRSDDVEVVALAGGLELLHLLEFADRGTPNGVATARTTVAWTLIWTGHQKGATCICKEGPIDRAGKGPRRGRMGNARSMGLPERVVNHRFARPFPTATLSASVMAHAIEDDTGSKGRKWQPDWERDFS